MRSRHCGFAVVVLYLSATWIPELTSAAPPAIYNLGTFGSGISHGQSVNDSGQVTGFSYYSNGNSASFLYTGTPGIDGVMHDLGMLSGEDINNAGQVVGVHNSHAALYSGAPNLDGAIADLGTLGGQESAALGVNNFGQVTGRSATANAAYPYHAFLYTGTPVSGGVMHDLGILFGDYSAGIDVNDSGQVAGASGYSTSFVGPYHAFLHTGTPGIDGVMHDLGTFGGPTSTGIGINNSGQVVGQSQTANGNQRAFLYSGTPGAGGQMIDLGTLGGAHSTAYDINDAGQIVGSSFTADGSSHAFLYMGTPGVDGRMIDLDAWLDATNPVEGAKWTLSGASRLSNNGWITGTGSTNQGSSFAYLLDASSLIVPEPCSLAMLMLTAPALMFRRRLNRLRSPSIEPLNK